MMHAYNYDITVVGATYIHCHSMCCGARNVASFGQSLNLCTIL